MPPGAAETIVFNHGTHVSGTAAGCVLDLTGPEDGPTSGTWSGVAPGASLHDYNVFPGFGAGFRAFGGSAFSHDIAAALEKAVLDGMDVVNMSIGGGVQGPHDLLAEATDATADAGVVPAVAAGNDGPGDSTISSPGSAPGALTAGEHEPALRRHSRHRRRNGDVRSRPRRVQQLRSAGHGLVHCHEPGDRL